MNNNHIQKWKDFKINESFNFTDIKENFQRIFMYAKTLDLKDSSTIIDAIYDKFNYGFDKHMALMIVSRMENHNIESNESLSHSWDIMKRMILNLPKSIKYALLGIVSLSISFQVAYYTSKEEVKFKIKDKQIKMEKSGDNINDIYFVYTDIGVFTNTDDAFLLKFNSSDVQNELNIGSTYKATVYGFRVPFLSIYKNITTVSKIE